MNLCNKQVLITGGASFIGSHLVDLLVKKGAKVRVVDNLLTGKIENIKSHIKRKNLEFFKDDLLYLETAKKRMKGVEVVFHLAAKHGGRGFVDWHQADCASNFCLDGIVFKAALEMNVKKVVFASSGCVYPNFIQKNPKEKIFLKEDLVKPPYDADNTYGYAKLMAELTLKAYYKEYGLQSASCRFFTVYGEKGLEDHAVMSMIARAFIKESPFVVWGTGEQVRNWTYVGDIVRGTVLAAEKIEGGTAVNLGTMERIKVKEAASEILRFTGRNLKLEFHPEMPTGPYNRVADNHKAKKLLGWQPKIKFVEGLHQTIDWYFKTKRKSEVKKILAKINKPPKQIK